MNDQGTPAHPPVQAINAAASYHPPHAYTQYPYGYLPHPTPYGYHAPQHVEANPPPPSTKRPLEGNGEECEGPTPTKFGGAARGRGRAKEPGHLWGWQRIGFYEDRPPPQGQPACQSVIDVELNLSCTITSQIQAAKVSNFPNQVQAVYYSYR